MAEIVERAQAEQRSGEQPAARPSRPASRPLPLPPAPYGAVPPPLAAPSARALAGHPTTDDPAFPQQRRTPRPATDGAGRAPGTRVSPLGAALPPAPAPPRSAPPRSAPLPAPPAAGPRTRSGEQVSFRTRFVPGPDDTQVIPVLPPVPAPSDEDTGTVEAREGTPGGSRGILRAAGTMAVASLVSRITGFLRTIVLTAALGLGLVGNAYTIANTLPNIVYELLIGGVLTSVIVPLLVNSQEKDADGGVRYTQRLMTLATAALAVLTVVAVLAAPALTWLMGIREDPDQVVLANWLARILLVEIVFYGIGALATAVLNARNVFGAPAWAPVLNNVVVIATGAVFLLATGPGALTPLTITPTQVWLLGLGTTLGIAVQALVLLPLLPRNGVPLRPQWGLRGTGLAEAGTLGLWVVGYVLVSQVGVVVASIVANRAADSGGLGPFAFSNASLLFQMPYGIIGVALLTALLPRMSRAAARRDRDGVLADLSLGTRLSAVGLLPVTALLVVLGPALGTVAFGRGNADVTDARGVGIALACGAFGLLPMAVTLLQLRVFYAMKDARTPTVIQIGMVAVRVPLLLLVPVLVDVQHVVAGLMVATSVTYLAGWAIGAVALRRRVGTGRGTVGPLVKLTLVSVVAASAAWGVLSLTTGVVPATVIGSLLTLLVGSLVIGVVVVVGVVLVGVPEIAGPLAAVRARLGGARR